MGQTLYDKLWDSHVVHVEEDGTALLYIDRHLLHEVTSPQAFEGLKLAGRKPWRIESVVATADHNTPTTGWERGLDGITDPISRIQVDTLEANMREAGAKAKAYFPFLDRRALSFELQPELLLNGGRQDRRATVSRRGPLQIQIENSGHSRLVHH